MNRPLQPDSSQGFNINFSNKKPFGVQCDEIKGELSNFLDEIDMLHQALEGKFNTEDKSSIEERIASFEERVNQLTEGSSSEFPGVRELKEAYESSVKKIRAVIGGEPRGKCEEVVRKVVDSTAKIFTTVVAPLAVGAYVGYKAIRGGLKKEVQSLLLPAAKVETEGYVREVFNNYKRSERGVEHSINNEKGDVKINCTIFPPKDHHNTPTDSNRRTVILCNANAMHYEEHGLPQEDNGDSKIESYRKKGYNVVVFNYRGVGKSKGEATTGQDLIDDTKMVFDYVKEKIYRGSAGADKKILLHGHSIGGGAAAGVAAEHPEANLLIERSFSKLSDAAEGIVSKYVFGLAKLVGKATSSIGFEIDSIANLKKRLSKGGGGKTFILNASDDQIISESARLSPERFSLAERSGVEFKFVGGVKHMGMLPRKLEKEMHDNIFGK